MNTFASNTIAHIDRGLIVIHAISFILMIAITIAMVYFCWRYSHKRNPVATDIHGHFWLEFWWSVIPVFIVMGMFFVGWDGFQTIRSLPTSVFEVRIDGQQFAWRYTYPNGKVLDPELRLPVNTPVKLNLFSNDVTHSFYIPAFRIKEDVVPNNPGYLSFTPLKTGIYQVFCAEFCGMSHSAMLSKLHIMPRDEFDEWYNGKQDQKPIPIEVAMTASPEQLKHGEAVFKQYCVTCHGPEGLGGGSNNARNFTVIDDKWVNGDKVSQMFRSLNAGVKQNMPSFAHLPNEDKFAAIHYVRTFAKTGHHEDTPEDIAKLNAEFEIDKGRLKPPEIPVAFAMDKLKQQAPERRVAADAEKIAALREMHPLGARVYLANCAACHGESGEGGAEEYTLSRIQQSRLNSPPLNLQNRPWQDDLAEFRRLLRGAALATGGLKPDFSTLSAKDWQALFDYTRALPSARAEQAASPLAQAETVSSEQ